jgi:hypothetical protein
MPVKLTATQNRTIQRSKKALLDGKLTKKQTKMILIFASVPEVMINKVINSK